MRESEREGLAATSQLLPNRWADLHRDSEGHASVTITTSTSGDIRSRHLNTLR